MKDVYVSDPKPSRFGVSNDRAVEIYSQKYGWSLDQAARAILTDEEYKKWSESHQGQ